MARRSTLGRWAAPAVAALCGILLGTVAPAPGYADDPTPGDAWHVAALDLDAAHRLGRGAGVTVALLDGSVEAHRDLRGALLPALDAAGGADDPESGSGTAGAGLIAARGDGVTGLRGVAPEAKLLPIRVGANAAKSEPPALARGIDLAVSRGAQVVAVSSVGSAEVTDDLRRAVRAAVAADVLVVAVASPLFGSIGTLGALPGVVSVGATDRDGRRQGLGADGNLDVDLVAPGEQVLSLLRLSGPGGDRYRTVAGPQYAVAIVAGVAALVRGRYPDLSAVDAIRRLRTTSTSGPSRRDLVRGWGVVNPVAALTAEPVALPPPVAPAGGAASTAGWLPRDSQWYLDALRIPEAHRVTRGAGVAIGMLTDSLYLDHPDLRGQVDSSAWQESDGRVRTGPLPERLIDSPSSLDVTGQTGVAGAAVARGGDGLLGIAPEADLVTVRSLNLTSRVVGPGLRWLTDHGSKVIIVPQVELDDAGQDAIRYAASRDVVLVGTASDDPTGVPGVLRVADLDADGEVQSGGSGLLAAPGGRHVLTANAGAKTGRPYGVTVLDGVGAGIVAGVAALVRARFPELNAASVVDRLVGTASPLAGDPAGTGQVRLVDPLAALTADRAPVRANPAGDPGPPRRAGSADGLSVRSMVLLAGAALALLVIVGVLVVLLVMARRRAASSPVPAGYPAPPGRPWPAGPPPAGPPAPPPGGSPRAGG